jgi:hypothetical protein
VFGFVSLLGFCLLNGYRAPAANPNFSHTVLLSPHDGQALLGLYFSDSPMFTNLPRTPSLVITFWTPTNADVAQVQDALWKYEALGADVIDPKWDELQEPHAIVLTTDTRQYAGVTINGRKHILIVGSTASGNSMVFNARDLGDDQQNRFSTPTDGGSAFKGIYDPTSRRIELLLFDHFVEKKTAMFTL